MMLFVVRGLSLDRGIVSIACEFHIVGRSVGDSDTLGNGVVWGAVDVMVAFKRLSFYCVVVVAFRFEFSKHT